MKKESGMSHSTKTLVVTLLVIAIVFSAIAICVNLFFLNSNSPFSRPSSQSVAATASPPAVSISIDKQLGASG
jgi:flagellar basal body-associated protein FliL